MPGHDAAPAPQAETPAPRSVGHVSHSPDFGTVRVGETIYTFSRKQRAMIRELFRAHHQGHGWLSSEVLLDAAESEGGKVWTIFRGHPAWGVLIQAAADHDAAPGCYRLALGAP